MNVKEHTLVLAIVVTIAAGAFGEGCVPRNYGKTSFVCVCNAHTCDSAPSVGRLAAGETVVISSSRSKARFQTTNLTFSHHSNSLLADEIYIDPMTRYQKIIGFGGAFTDATGINIYQLSILAQQQLVRSYFSSDGIEYGIGRVPIGGTDFSTYPYTYNDLPGDVNLTSFNLTKEDLFYKIPYITWAKEHSSKPLKLFGSPWSAPAWMKSNNKLFGKGFLLLDYYQAYADYFVRFFEEYAKHDITFWGLTTQNEPLDGNVDDFGFNCMGWTPEAQALFIGLNLGPTLNSSGFGDLKIMMLDDQRILLPKWARIVMAHPEARKYVSGIGVHWYGNLLSPPSVLTATHNLFPETFILATEACEGDKPWQEKVILGSWERAEGYAHDIIENLNNWVTGWVDWNMALDEKGGPNWTNSAVDSPIIVNATADEFYKQPMYYAMGHFSKYLPEESVRIALQVVNTRKLFATAFERPDGNRVVVLLNRSDEARKIIINDPERGALEFDCQPRSINTVVYG